MDEWDEILSTSVIESMDLCVCVEMCLWEIEMLSFFLFLDRKGDRQICEGVEGRMNENATCSSI